MSGGPPVGKVLHFGRMKMAGLKTGPPYIYYWAVVHYRELGLFGGMVPGQIRLARYIA